MLQALRDNTPVPVRFMQHPLPRPGSTLILYGLGAADRYGMALRHVENGGTLVCWDMGYWDRKGDQRKLRVSINGLHPPKYVMRGPRPDASRWEASGLQIEQRGDPNGPIVLVGNGPKSNVIGAAGWAAGKSREIRERFPNKRIVYRPKPQRPHDRGVDFDSVDEGPIDALLARSSLVVCRHSNVAVDACRLGVPVVCDDGAAAAIYPSQLDGSQPSTELREDFLHRIAWWQWSHLEAREAWAWLLQTLETAR